MSDIFDQIGSSTPPAHGGGDIFDQVGGGAPTDWRDKYTEIESQNKRPGILGHVATGLSNIGAGGLGMILHPVDTIGSAARMGAAAMSGNYGDLANQLQPTAESLVHDPVGTIEAGIGQAGAGGLLGEAAPPVLDAAGSLLKKAGRGAGNVVLGANAADRAFNTRPGAGISENRIISATRPGLLQKVKAQIDPLTTQRDAILANSPVEGMDIRRDVNQPFHDIRTAKTDPVTGGADPAGLSRLTMMQKVANLAQDPLTGRPLESPPQLKPLHSMSPLEAGQLNTNLRDMATYNASQPEGTLAEQALKGAGSNIRQSLADAVPESVDTTQQLHDTLGARDKLQSQLQQRELHPARTLFSAVAKNVADPALVAGGSTLASGLDLAGSAAKTAAKALRRPVGPPPASPPPNYGIQQAPPPPPPAGMLPQFSGQAAGEPPMAPTLTTKVNPAQPIRYPNLQGEPLQLPQSATSGFTSPNPKPPPNVSLKERLQPRASGLTPQPVPPLQGQPGPGRIPQPTMGPEGPGQFQSSPRRLTARVDGFPVQDRPVFGIDTSRISPESLIKEAGELTKKVKAGKLKRPAPEWVKVGAEK